MPPSYVIVMQSDDCVTADVDIAFNDDVHAIVAARRLFVQEVVTRRRRPLSLIVGRSGPDGQVHWLSTWSSSPVAAPTNELSSGASAWRGVRKTQARRRATVASRRAAAER